MYLLRFDMNKKFFRIIFACFISCGVLITQCDANVGYKKFQKTKNLSYKKSSSKGNKSAKAGKISKADVLKIGAHTLKNQFIIINNVFSKNIEAEDITRINKKSLFRSKESTVTSRDLQNFIRKLKNKFIGDSINCLTALMAQVENITKRKLPEVDKILDLKGSQIDSDMVQKLLCGDNQKNYKIMEAKYGAINNFESMDVLFKTIKHKKTSNDHLSDGLKIETPIKQKETKIQTKIKSEIYKHLKQDISEMMRLAKKIEKESKGLIKFKKLSATEKEHVIKKVSETIEELAKILVKYTLKFNDNSKYHYDLNVSDLSLDALVEDADKRKIVDEDSTDTSLQTQPVISNELKKDIRLKENSKLEKKLDVGKRKLETIEKPKILDFSMTEDEIKSEATIRK